MPDSAAAARACPQKTADIDGLRYSPDNPHYGLGPVHSEVKIAFITARKEIM